jgi:hypothetical protein
MKDKLALLLLGAIAIALVDIGLLTRETGSLVAVTPGVELQLKGGFGSSFALRSGTEPVAVPARAYKPTALTLVQKQDGDVWQLWSRGPWGQLARIRAERGRTTTIEVGPPLQIKPQVEMYPGQVRVGLCLFGRSGEKYENSILKNEQRISEPQVKIVDEAGTVLASGRFQFG